MLGKAKLDWIDDSRILEPATPGVYRINRFDHEDADEQPALALKVQRLQSETFWLGYRKKFPAADPISNGAYLLWQYRSEAGRLVDTTPISVTNQSLDADRVDAPIAVGESFTDPSGSFRVTVQAQGGSPPLEYIDIKTGPSAGHDRALLCLYNSGRVCSPNDRVLL